MTEISGRAAVVSGGGSGLGRGVALALAAEGARVVIADIMPENAEAVRTKSLRAAVRRSPRPATSPIAPPCER